MLVCVLLWERVFPSDYKCSRENRTGQLASVQFFARALRASGLTWLWPHMALAIDHVRVMQRVAGPEA